ncbi:unnamed protein product [Cuscuta campestris]|uniref:Uncharacterized protein n=1 Tax=Cuscuta campestris TaxID=132261 RepID=A0A484MSA6_9ASTE|nr:unnamed protein product [Cuscuta campestris]
MASSSSTQLPPSSANYLAALAMEIQKKLLRAIALPSERHQLLQELLADIALEVDDRARGVIFGSEKSISAAEERNKGPICYFNVLTDHFVNDHHCGKPILDLIVQLWSQSFVSHIFSLLFHKWLFEVELENTESLIRYSSALVHGATNVFWIDVQSNMKCFQSLFMYLIEEVAFVPERLKKIPLQAQRDLFLVLSRYIFFYDSVDKLESFLSQFPDFPNALFIGGPADFFVIELADKLQQLKVEPVLLHYLSQMKVLSGVELRMTTSTRLRTCLYSFTSPGAPMYPTRAVRHAARDVLDFLFPVGRYPRHLISLFFRLLHPCWDKFGKPKE